MEIFSETNLVRLCGSPEGPPRYSHSSRGQDFYLLPLRVRRLSGVEDRLNLTLRQELLPAVEAGGGKLAVTGELRSFNNHRGNGPKLVLTVFVRELEGWDGEDQNLVRLQGALCRPPKLRCTPLGREIADLMLAVNRRCGRSDYLPCICWGTLARRAQRWDTGQRLQLEGRLQSREYTKITEAGSVLRTAFEVSVARAEELPLL